MNGDRGFRLDGRRVLITGACHGIGRSIAIEFARAGAQIALSDRDPDHLGDTLGVLRDLAGDVPFDSSYTRRVLSLTFSRSTDLATGRVFDARLREATKVVQARTNVESHASVYDSLVRVAADVDLVLISAYVPPRTSEPLLALPDALTQFVSRVEGRLEVRVAVGLNAEKSGW